MSGGLIAATFPWDDPDAWRETANIGGGSGNKGVPQAYRFPAPDDPDVLRCLNCELPETACNTDAACPFSTRAQAARKRVEDAARYISRRDMAHAVKACREAG